MLRQEEKPVTVTLRLGEGSYDFAQHDSCGRSAGVEPLGGCSHHQQGFFRRGANRLKPRLLFLALRHTAYGYEPLSMTVVAALAHCIPTDSALEYEDYRSKRGGMALNTQWLQPDF